MLGIPAILGHWGSGTTQLSAQPLEPGFEPQ